MKHIASSYISVVEMFCGFGGTAQGIHRAGAEVLCAVDYLPVACETYAANFPNTDIRKADLVDRSASNYLNPADLPSAQVLFASPSCKHHSPANFRREYHYETCHLPFFQSHIDNTAYKESEYSRKSMLAPLYYIEKHRPELVCIENVAEVVNWGPDRDGSTFRWWLKEWKKLGYDYRLLSLNSQFFPPTPQSRDRLYIVCWRKDNTAPDLDFRPTAYCISDVCSGKTIKAVQAWTGNIAKWNLKQPVGKYKRQYVYRCPVCHTPVEPIACPASSVIDWSNLGIRIGDRGKPLADATIQRIRKYLAKFSYASSTEQSTIFADYKLDRRPAVPPALFVKQNSGAVAHELCIPLNTVTSHDTTGLVVFPWIDQYMSEPVSVTEPLATITSHARHALVPIDAGEITNEIIESVRFRMLEPDPELRRAMAFDDSYILKGNRSEMIAGLGNAVTPPVATAIAERMFATLSGETV